jgi:hypothetical protein
VNFCGSVLLLILSSLLSIAIPPHNIGEIFSNTAEATRNRRPKSFV